MLRDFNETLEAELKDPEFVVFYLKAALEDNGTEIFLLALRNVIQATRGMAQVAADIGLDRESFYKTLSESGNPQFSTVQKLLSALGL